MADVVPINPEKVPATKTFLRVGGQSLPENVIPTASNTIVPNSKDRRSPGTKLSTRTPKTAPTTLPGRAHLTPAVSIAGCSRFKTRRLSMKEPSNRGPGTKTGSIRTSNGTPIRPKPKPIDPCKKGPKDRYQGGHQDVLKFEKKFHRILNLIA